MGIVPGYLPSYRPVMEFIELFRADEKPMLPQVGLTREESCIILSPYEKIASPEVHLDVEEHISAIQAKLRERQQIGIVAGRCLRLFIKNSPLVSLSRMTCQMVQMLDLNYFAASTRYMVASLSLKVHWSTAYFYQRKGAEDIFRKDLQPAEALFEKSIGVKYLFDRPLKIPEETWCPIL